MRTFEVEGLYMKVHGILPSFPVAVMSACWPPSEANDFGMTTLSLGNWRGASTRTPTRCSRKAGYKWIDLFDECWAA
ncbi:uncharacterized protein N7498_004508 [Penicillium cinerascens]|uniref:Uncharacterized protein n=1 Tax=Penicillium cinerascens TaxID=70096 RepID=A0A9W9SZA8_9EURO|nr:uncharacterized protein N7498_004508 [Penicillium cinerascens]KAJ5203629.1 hypothetical protein N7498_004508 [Penicillium cinerascens]